MTNPTPLNPDALEAAENMFIFMCADGYTPKAEDAAESLVSAYLAVAQPEVNRDKAMAWFEGFEAGWDEAKDPGAFVNDVWDAKTPNPYAEER